MHACCETSAATVCMDRPAAPSHTLKQSLGPASVRPLRRLHHSNRQPHSLALLCATKQATELSSTQKSRAVNRQRDLPVLSLLSECVELQDVVRSFEVQVGRHAMVGFLVAFAVEAVTERGLFYNITAEQVQVCSSIALLTACLGAGLAFVSKQRLGDKVKEAVITSLTAARRSAASVSQTQVDSSVDGIFDKVFEGFSVFDDLLEDDFY